MQIHLSDQGFTLLAATRRQRVDVDQIPVCKRTVGNTLTSATGNSVSSLASKILGTDSEATMLERGATDTHLLKA